MLVATFGGDTAWSGRRITQEDGRFVLEGFGVISAAQILDYDAVTPLAWSTGGTRAWVRSIAHREGGKARPAGTAPPAMPAGRAVDRPAAAPDATQDPSGVFAPDAARAPATAAAPATPAPARPPECTFTRAHYVGGQPSLGAPLPGTLHVSTAALVLRGEDPGLGVSVALADVDKVSLHSGDAPGAAGVSATVAAGGPAAASPPGNDRTFLVAHLRPKGYEAFAVDGLGREAVAGPLQRVLDGAGVALQGGVPVHRAPRAIDEVQRLAELHASGAISGDQYRERLGPVFTAGTEEDGRADEDGGPVEASGPARMSAAAREAAIARLSQLRLSGAISDAELAAMRAKLQE